MIKNTRTTDLNIIRIFRRMEKKPLKVFVAQDFSGNPIHTRIGLNCLIVLGIVEQVPAIYRIGNREWCRKEVKGYKLLRGGG